MIAPTVDILPRTELLSSVISNANTLTFPAIAAIFVGNLPKPSALIKPTNEEPIAKLFHIMFSDWNQLVFSQMSKDREGWSCLACQYYSKNKNNVISHVQSKHVPDFSGYTCSVCSSVCSTYNSIEKHMSRHHNISLAKLLKPSHSWT